MSAPGVVSANPRVAFQGEAGAYGEAAISQRWHGRAHPVPARTFVAVLALVCAGGADYGLIPVWNSTIGEIDAARAALDGHAHLVIARDELLVPVRHCLLGLPGASLDAVRLVGSHPAALAQCARFFDEHPRVSSRAAFDTAGAARELAMLAGPRAPLGAEIAPWYGGAPIAEPRELAVIASATVASLYGLELLARDVQDDPGNATRFLVVQAREAERS
jgi:prephenate dehydratase